jgi:hypothetical protein
MWRSVVRLFNDVSEERHSSNFKFWDRVKSCVSFLLVAWFSALMMEAIDSSEKQMNVCKPTRRQSNKRALFVTFPSNK